MTKQNQSSLVCSILIVAISFFISINAQAQWVTLGADIYNSNAGNVGIGIGAAGAVEKLELNGIFYLRNVAAPGTTANRLYSVSGNLHWNGLNISSGLLPSGATGRTLYHNGSIWTSSTTLYNNGTNIGIGTTSPSSKFHVLDGAILFNGSSGSTPVSGVGQRFMWIPAKSSLRAGYATSSNWDNTNIGDYSAAFGYGTRASGLRSFATGFNTSATGVNSFAWGDSTKATDTNTTAFGYYTLASGDNSLAAGQNTIASGKNSIAFGNSNTASGENSFASGLNSKATAMSSFAHGKNVTANGLYSFAFGSNVTNNSNIGCYIASDTSNSVMNNDTPNQFKARYQGGYKLYSNGAGTIGVRLFAGTSGWASISDVNMKENFKDLDLEKVLISISKIKVSEWSYKTADPNIRYIGPMAQDFAKEFKLSGKDTKSINTIDIDGVNMAGIQALEKRTSTLKTQNEELTKTVESLKQELQSLKESIASLLPTQSITLPENSKKAMLLGNDPNPFTDKTVINYFIPEGTEKAEIIINETNGNTILLRLDIQKNGYGKIEVNKGLIKPGIYVYSLLINGGIVDSKKMILTK